VKARRLVAAVFLAGVTAVATLAVAQPRKPPPKPTPAPKPAAKPDAGAPASSAAPAPEETATLGGSAPDPAKSAAASEPPPPPAAETADGGRPSPLNPTAQEMPGTIGDAGAPVDYDRLLADIAALRARVAAVSDNLYQSRVAISVQTDGDHGKIARLTVSLDDGVVYTAPGSFAASDATMVYDHAVAPGRHAVTVDVEPKDDREESFRTAQRSRFTIDVPRDNRVAVEVKLIDDSAMAKDFPPDKSGKYDLRVKLRAVAKPVGK